MFALRTIVDPELKAEKEKGGTNPMAQSISLGLQGVRIEGPPVRLAFWY